MNEREPSDAVQLGAMIALVVLVLIVFYGFEGHVWISTQLCGAASTATDVRYRECAARTEQHALFLTLTIGGALIGVLLRHQMRREARRDAERDKAVNVEMDRIRGAKRG